MSRKGKLLNGASPAAAVQFAEQYRRAVTKPTPVGLVTAPLPKEAPAVYRVED